MLMEQVLPLDQPMRYVQEQRGKSASSTQTVSGRKVEDTAAPGKSRGISAAAYLGV